MVSIAAFLKYKGSKHLGGVIGLVGMQAFDYKKYVVFKNEQEKQMVDTIRQQTPIFLLNGKPDEHLSIEAASLSYKHLIQDVLHDSANVYFEIDKELKHDFAGAIPRVGSWLRKQIKQQK